MNKKRIIYRVTLYVLIASLLVCIFLFSSKTGEQSYEQSEGITDDVVDAIAPDLGNDHSAEGQKTKMIIHLAFRKIAHVCEFALLSFLVTLLLETYGMKKWWLALSAVGFTILYAVSDEVHQHFVPDRIGSIGDVGFDSIGAVLGWSVAVLAIWLFYRIVNRKQSQDK